MTRGPLRLSRPDESSRTKPRQRSTLVDPFRHLLWDGAI